MSFLKLQGQGLLKFCISVHCHEREILCIFLDQTSYTLDKNSPLKWSFWTFEWLGQNSPKSWCLLWSQNKFVFLQTLHHSSVWWNITFLYFSSKSLSALNQRIQSKFSSWNIYFWQKEPIRLLRTVMEVHPVAHAIFETTRPGFIQILHHCLVSWKITPLYFLSQTAYTLDKNSSSKWNFWAFECLGENSPNSSCQIWKWNNKSVFL